MFGHWLDTVLNGAPEIKRWQGMRMLARKNDAEHMFGVAIIGEGLSRIQMEVFGTPVDKNKVVNHCLFHDIPEVALRVDLPSGLKRASKNMEIAIADAEEVYYNSELKPLIYKSWRDEYKHYMLNPKEDKQTIEGKIVAVADSVDALNECIQEVKLGNSTFKPYLEIIANSILDIDIECAKYFIKYELLDFGLPAIAYGKTVEKFIKKYEFENTKKIVMYEE